MGHPLVHVTGHAVCVCVCVCGGGGGVGVWCGCVGVGVNGMCEGCSVNIVISLCCDD